jgi:hypothetical protein
MQNKKQKKHLGQRQLDGTTEYDLQTNGNEPRGMPTLEMIKTETARFGLPDSDAEHIRDVWLANGYKTGRNKVVDWRAVIRLWFRNGYFPSLKKIAPKPGELMTNEILDALAQNPAYKKVDVQAEAWKFKKWCEENDRALLVTSFIKFLNGKL